MIIGYVGEDSAHSAFLEGLRQRTGWCPQAQLVEGGRRGKGERSWRRQIRNICFELNRKGADVMIFLRDADAQSWREAKAKESQLIPSEYKHKSIYGVANRNIECWLAADRTYLAQQLGMNPTELAIDDPSRIIKNRLGADKSVQIIAIVTGAPLWNWIQNSESFADFYNDVRDLSQQMGCNIPNEREKG